MAYTAVVTCISFSVSGGTALSVGSMTVSTSSGVNTNEKEGQSICSRNGRTQSRTTNTGMTPALITWHATTNHGDGEGGLSLHIWPYGRSRMITDPHIPSMPGRNKSSFHRSGRYRVHQARMRDSFVACVNHRQLTIQPLLRTNTVLTPKRETVNIWAFLRRWGEVLFIAVQLRSMTATHVGHVRGGLLTLAVERQALGLQLVGK